MKEYICNECGTEFLGPDDILDAECPECYAIDCQIAYEDIEKNQKSKEIISTEKEV